MQKTGRKLVKAVAMCNHITQAISALPSKKVTSADRSTEGKKLLCSAECMGKKADFYENYLNLGGEIIFYFDIDRIFFDQEGLDLETLETRPAITIMRTDGTSEDYLVSQSGIGNVKAAIKIIRPIVQDVKFKL
ncbi:MAG: hypothetical protein IJ305_08995 [Oscillospiraceae bacterium]|nr:hypothetical protein [Oscillospiraceae bacterium]